MTTTNNNVLEAKKVSSTNTPNGAKSEEKTVKTEKVEQKAEASKTTINEILNPTAEQRISKLKTFEKLTSKYETLKDKQEKFDVFRATQDGTGQTINLFNSNGYEFEVSNNETFRKVLDVIAEDLTKFLSIAKQEVLSFQI